jgi:excisionase family DNA binding protein
MAGTPLTTKEVARLLGVSEATIKRWADGGLIQSEKTAGGHRRFGLAGIASFQRQGEKPLRASASAAGKHQSRAKISVTEFFNHLVGGHEHATGALLIDGYLHGESLASLFDRVVTPAMHQIGESWYRGELTIADEHLATRTAIAALQKLRSVIQLAPVSEFKALICGIEGDLHELPIHLSHALLEADGWEVIDLGPNTPFFALVESVTKQRPQLLCISAKLMTDPDRLARDYGPLHKAARKVGCAIVLGGDAFADKLLRQRFPSEFYAKGFKQLMEFTSALVQTRA